MNINLKRLLANEDFYVNDLSYWILIIVYSTLSTKFYLSIPIPLKYWTNIVFNLKSLRPIKKNLVLKEGSFGQKSNGTYHSFSNFLSIDIITFIATLEKPVYELDETPHVTKGPVVNKDNARQKEPRTPIRITPVNKKTHASIRTPHANKKPHAWRYDF